MSSEHDRHLTRRTLLGGAVAAGAASVLAPAESLAAALGPPPGVFSRWVGSLQGTSGVIAAERRFELVGAQWAAPAHARIELRTRGVDGRWSPWALASVCGHGPDGVRAPAGHSRFGEPIWSGPAEAVQVRSDVAVGDVRLHFVSARVSGPATAAAALPLVATGLDAGPGQPPIIARAAWARGGAPPRFPPAYGSVKLAFVHHSEGPNGYRAADVPSILMSIYQFHRFVRGWNDIGYNFAIDAFGRIWEARAGGVDAPVSGAQAGGYNYASTGVVILGTFIGVLPPAAALAALERLLAWKLSVHGSPVLGRVGVRVDPNGAEFTRFAPDELVSLPRVAGHRDGDQTACPGSALYARLPSMRPRVARLAGTPAKLTLLADPQELTPGTTVTLSGRLVLPGGAAAGGAPIELQTLARHGGALGAATTVATAIAARGRNLERDARARREHARARAASAAPGDRVRRRAARRRASHHPPGRFGVAAYGQRHRVAGQAVCDRRPIRARQRAPSPRCRQAPGGQARAILGSAWNASARALAADRAHGRRCGHRRGRVCAGSGHPVTGE